MAVNIFPSPSSGPIKSIQRGVASTAGNITISAVNVSKTIVNSFSTGSAGSVAVRGDITGTLTRSGGALADNSSFANQLGGGSFPTYSGTRTLSGGTTNLTSAENGVYLSNSTTLVATGPCRYEVVEFN